MTREVCWPVQTHKGRAHCFVFTLDFCFVLTNPRRGYRNCRRQNCIHPLERCLKIAFHLSLYFKCSKVIHCAHLRPHLEPAAHIRSVFRGARGIESLRLMVTRGFGQRDIRAGIQGIAKMRKRDVLEPCARRDKYFCCSLNRALDLRINALEEIFSWPSQPESLRTISL